MYHWWDESYITFYIKTKEEDYYPHMRIIV